MSSIIHFLTAVGAIFNISMDTVSRGLGRPEQTATRSARRDDSAYWTYAPQEQRCRAGRIDDPNMAEIMTGGTRG
jgi:hypothetical protein